MKKQFAFVLMIVAVITSCSSGSGDGTNFTVSGKIENGNAKNIFLEQVPYDNTEPKVVDSGKLAADGSYSLKAIAKEQSLYILTLDHQPVSFFINDIFLWLSFRRHRPILE